MLQYPIWKYLKGQIATTIIVLQGHITAPCTRFRHRLTKKKGKGLHDGELGAWGLKERVCMQVLVMPERLVLVCTFFWSSIETWEMMLLPGTNSLGVRSFLNVSKVETSGHFGILPPEILHRDVCNISATPLAFTNSILVRKGLGFGLVLAIHNYQG